MSQWEDGRAGGWVSVQIGGRVRALVNAVRLLSRRQGECVCVSVCVCHLLRVSVCVTEGADVCLSGRLSFVA